MCIKTHFFPFFSTLSFLYFFPCFSCHPNIIYIFPLIFFYSKSNSKHLFFDIFLFLILHSYTCARKHIFPFYWRFPFYIYIFYLVFHVIQTLIIIIIIIIIIISFIFLKIIIFFYCPKYFYFKNNFLYLKKYFYP